MILDVLNQFASAFAPTGTGTNFSTYYIDRQIGMDDGKGSDLIFYVRVGTTCTTGGGSATVDFRLYGNPTDPTFSSGNVLITSTGPIAFASLVSGFEPAKLKFPRTIPQETTWATGPLRYLVMDVHIATAALTAGAFDAWLTPDDPQDNMSYPRNYTA